jgi:ATP-dependent Clp protease ATP-binding subunit ClpA
VIAATGLLAARRLEPARRTGGANLVLDFSPWIVAMTNNIGAARIMAMRRSLYETMRRLVEQDARHELRPEIFNRITEAVVLNKLDYSDLSSWRPHGESNPALKIENLLS